MISPRWLIFYIRAPRTDVVVPSSGEGTTPNHLTNLQKLQTTQNSALRVVTGCTPDTNTQHLHKETTTLPLSNHLKLHASQLRQKSQLPTHPLHDLIKQSECPRKKKQTIFNDWGKKTVSISNSNTIPPTPETISQNLKTIHTTIVDLA